MYTTRVEATELHSEQIKNHIIFFSGGTASFAVAAWVKKTTPMTTSFCISLIHFGNLKIYIGLIWKYRINCSYPCLPIHLV